MNGSPFTMEYRPLCSACWWAGRGHNNEPDADEEILDHATTGQHKRNMERRTTV
jgi:hypothetical protein